MIAQLVYFLLLVGQIFSPTPDTEEPSREAIAHRTEFYCAALVVFSEARGESPRGQALVAAVVRNRANIAGAYLCDIAVEEHQFYGLEDWPLPRRPWRREPVAWRQAQAITEVVLLGWYDDGCSEHVTMFHVKQGKGHGKCVEGNHEFQ